MSSTAKIVNNKYLNELRNPSSSKKCFSRINDLWWPIFITEFKKNPFYILDNLDYCMGKGRDQLIVLARQYAKENGNKFGSVSEVQKVNQFLKSNTGKMFERFIGLVIAFYLEKFDSNYCIWPFRKDLKNVCDYLHIEDLMVQVKLGEKKYSHQIDCDLLIFNPERIMDFYLISVKSTLKDRFHNVPFWNLLRLAALKNTPFNLVALNPTILNSAKYIAVCSDLAKEQPDFSNENGPRNLLCLDASLLDGAYVTSTQARGLGKGENHIGIDRSSPFFPLSSFIKYLLR